MGKLEMIRFHVEAQVSQSGETVLLRAVETLGVGAGEAK
jgi:hypothetical protein